MSHLKLKIQLLEEKRKLANRHKSSRIKPIDRNYTTFGGNGCLTKEQYDKGMSLSRKMKDMSAW